MSWECVGYHQLKIMALRPPFTIWYEDQHRAQPWRTAYSHVNQLQHWNKSL